MQREATIWNNTLGMLALAPVLAWLIPASTYAQNVHSGSFAARITNSSPATCTAGDTGLDRFRKTFHGVSGNRLKISFWLRKAGDKPGKVMHVSMSGYHDQGSRNWNGNDTHWLKGHTVGDKWESHEFDYKIPDGNPWLNFQVRVEPGSSLLVDAVSIKDIDEDGKEMLTNGGFEDWPESMRFMPPVGWRFFAAGCSTGSIERMLAKAPALTWKTSLAEGRAMAVKTGKPLLINFYAPEAAASKHFEAVFTDPELAMFLRDKFILLRLDMLKNSATATQMQVHRAGTITIYHHSGKGLLRVDDKPAAAELLSRLSELKP